MRHVVPFLFGLLLIAFILQVDLFFTIAYFLIGVYILSRLWVRHAVKRVVLSRRFVDRAFVGDIVRVSVLVRNTGRLPVPWIQVAESVPIALQGIPVPPRVMTLGAHEQEQFSYEISCRRRGYYTLGPFYLSVGDLVGAESQLLSKRIDDRLLVYPRVLSIDRLGLQSLAVQPALVTASPLVEDPARVFGVRDYAQGDSPRRIHWAASARLSRLTVKQYEPAIARETMIFLDLDQADYDRWNRDDAIELAIVTAASLANHIIVCEHLPAGLATEAADTAADHAVHRFCLAPRPERAQLLAILEVLARINPIEGGEFPAALRRQSVSLSWGATIIAITGTAGDELLETLLYLRRGGFAVSLVLVQPVPGMTARLGAIPVHVVRWDADVEAWA